MMYSFDKIRIGKLVFIKEKNSYEFEILDFNK